MNEIEQQYRERNEDEQRERDRQKQEEAEIARAKELMHQGYVHAEDDRNKPQPASELTVYVDSDETVYIASKERLLKIDAKTASVSVAYPRSNVR